MILPSTWESKSHVPVTTNQKKNSEFLELELLGKKNQIPRKSLKFRESPAQNLGESLQIPWAKTLGNSFGPGRVTGFSVALPPLRVCTSSLGDDTNRCEWR